MFRFSHRDSAWLFLTIAFSMICWFKPWSKEDNMKLAFAECLEEVQKNCSGVISYAIALEEENSLLNKKAKRCNK